MPLLAAAVTLLAIQFVFHKKYQLICGSGMRSGLWYNFISGLFTAVLGLVLSGFSLALTPYSLFLAALTAVLVFGHTMVGFRIMKYGKMAVYTMFLMLGGMLVPSVCGVLFFGEHPTISVIVGIVCLTLSLVAFSLSEGKDRREITQSQRPLDAKFWILCVAVFVFNGLVSTFSKQHQVETFYHTLNEFDFTFWSGVCRALISIGALPFSKKVSAQTVKGSRTGAAFLFALAATVTAGLSYVLQLYGNKEIDASVLYPMLTGGTVVLTTLAGAMVFREKPSRRTAVCVAAMFLFTFLFLW